jgi:hypothetical protein
MISSPKPVFTYGIKGIKRIKGKRSAFGMLNGLTASKKSNCHKTGTISDQGKSAGQQPIEIIGRGERI